MSHIYVTYLCLGLSLLPFRKECFFMIEMFWKKSLNFNNFEKGFNITFCAKFWQILAFFHSRSILHFLFLDE